MIAATGWTGGGGISPSVLLVPVAIVAVLIAYAVVSEAWRSHKRAQGRRYS